VCGGRTEARAVRKLRRRFLLSGERDLLSSEPEAGRAPAGDDGDGDEADGGEAEAEGVEAAVGPGADLVAVR
jgi:hypothetical protein